jgi:hypothetical protein
MMVRHGSPQVLDSIADFGFGKNPMNNTLLIRFLDSWSGNRKSSQRYLKFLSLFLTEPKRDDSRKDAKAPRFGEMNNTLSLRAWRLGAITIFVTSVKSVICERQVLRLVVTLAGKAPSP